MRKIASLAAVLVIATGAVSACSSSVDAYCGDLKANADTLKPSQGDPAPTIAKMKKLRDQAPEELRDDWGVAIRFMEILPTALKRMQDPNYKPEVTAEQLKVAADAISKHAKDECGFDMPQ